MPDKKLTDNEIIEGFEHCLKNNSCNGCVFKKTNICDGSLEDKIKTLKIVDDVVNSQKAEIEKLNKELQVTRQYIHDNGLEWDLLSYSKRNGG